MIILLQPNNRGTASQGNETFRVNMGPGGQAANQAQTGQAFPGHPSQSFPHMIQIPLAGAAVSVPSIHAVAYFSLSKLWFILLDRVGFLALLMIICLPSAFSPFPIL